MLDYVKLYMFTTDCGQISFFVLLVTVLTLWEAPPKMFYNRI